MAGVGEGGREGRNVRCGRQAGRMTRMGIKGIIKGDDRGVSKQERE